MMRGSDHLLDRAAAGLVLLLAAQALWPLQATGVVLMAFSLVQLVRAVRGGLLTRPRHGPLVLAAVLPFALLAARAPFSADPSAAWLMAERTVPLALLPILLLLGPPVALPRQVPLDVLSIAGLLLGLRGIVLPVLEDPSLLEAPRPLREAFARATGMHAVYGAYNLCVAALVQMAPAWKQRAPLRGLLIGACVLLASLLASRMPVIALGVSLVVLAASSRLPWQAVLRLTPAAGILLVLVLALPTLRERFIEVLDTPLAVPVAATSDTGERWALVHCSMELVKAHPWAGMGPDAVRKGMDDCLRGVAGGAYADGHHGPHDQLLLWWAALGLAGAFAFILLFAVPARQALRRRDGTLLAVLAYFALCCFTEDLLDRQWGVVLFAFISTWMAASAYGGKDG